MTTVNLLMLSGIICKTPIRKISPSGITHCQFVLEHRSMQQEVNLLRQSWCRLPVVVSGKETMDITSNISVGTQIAAQGFISWHQGRNGLGKIVLHAKKIDLIESGD